MFVRPAPAPKPACSIGDHHMAHRSHINMPIANSTSISSSDRTIVAVTITFFIGLSFRSFWGPPRERGKPPRQCGDDVTAEDRQAG